MAPAGRFTALVVHGDGGQLDRLTRRFEEAGFDVIPAPTTFRAQAFLEGERPIEVVVAPWDVTHALGGDVYRWVLENRPDLRSRFVFVADDVPADFDSVVRGRCLTVPPSGLEELVRVATGVARRVRTPPRGMPVIRGPGRPPLLLADDDSLLLGAMADALTQEGYSVSQVDSIKSAIELAEFRDFDVIVVDWHMHDGSGVDLYRWLSANKPHLVERVVFLSEGDQDDSGPVAPGRPMFRKGQDSQALVEVLREIVARVRS